MFLLYGLNPIVEGAQDETVFDASTPIGHGLPRMACGRPIVSAVSHLKRESEKGVRKGSPGSPDTRGMMTIKPIHFG